MTAARVCDKVFICCEPADTWTRIGRLDSAGRRSTWARVERIEGPPRDSSFFEEHEIIAVELCGGREGDDAYVRVERGDPSFVAMLNLVMYAIDNIDWDEECAERAARSAHEKQTADQEARFARGELGVEELTDPKLILHQRLRKESTP